MSKHTKTYAATEVGQFTIVAEWEQEENSDGTTHILWIDYKCYRIQKLYRCRKPIYGRSTDFPPGLMRPNETANLAEAESILDGHVRWDGCCNIWLFPENEGYFHACDQEEATAIGPLITRLYEITRELLPGFEG